MPPTTFPDGNAGGSDSKQSEGWKSNDIKLTSRGACNRAEQSAKWSARCLSLTSTMPNSLDQYPWLIFVKSARL